MMALLILCLVINFFLARTNYVNPHAVLHSSDVTNDGEIALTRDQEHVGNSFADPGRDVQGARESDQYTSDLMPDIHAIDADMDEIVNLKLPSLGGITALISFSQMFIDVNVPEYVDITTLRWSLNLGLRATSRTLLESGELQVVVDAVASLLDIDMQCIHIDSIVFSASAYRIEEDGSINDKVNDDSRAIAEQDQSFDLDIRATLTIPLTDSFASYESEPSSLAHKFLNILQGHINTGNFDTALHDTASNAGFDAATRPTSLLSVSVAKVTSAGLTVRSPPAPLPEPSPIGDPIGDPIEDFESQYDDAANNASVPHWLWSLVIIGVVFLIYAVVLLVCGTVFLVVRALYRVFNQQQTNSNSLVPTASTASAPVSVTPHVRVANTIAVVSTTTTPGLYSSTGIAPYPRATAEIVRPVVYATASLASVPATASVTRKTTIHWTQL